MAERVTYSVNWKDGLNLREKPNKESKVLAVLPYGEKIKVDKAADVPDGWLAVKGGGYVMSEFLK